MYVPNKHNKSLYLISLASFSGTNSIKAPSKKEQQKAIDECPDLCAKHNSSWLGNVPHPTDKHKFLACWHGTTMGCGVCEKPRYFDENQLTCVWPGGLNYDPNA